MSKFPLTPTGVDDLLAVLYLLPNDLLQAESNALFVDFEGWVIDKFDLLPHQETFLLGLPLHYVSYTANRSSFAMANRLPINFIVPLRKSGEDPPVDPDKRIKTLDKTALSSDPEGLPTGSVDLEVTY